MRICKQQTHMGFKMPAEENVVREAREAISLVLRMKIALSQLRRRRLAMHF